MASAELSVDEVPAELEHIIGFSSKYPNTCLAHPVDQDKVIYNMASLVVISDLSDPYVALVDREGELSGLKSTNRIILVLMSASSQGLDRPWTLKRWL
jgi:hypothetical protein